MKNIINNDEYKIVSENEIYLVCVGEEKKYDVVNIFQNHEDAEYYGITYRQLNNCNVFLEKHFIISSGFKEKYIKNNK